MDVEQVVEQLVREVAPEVQPALANYLNELIDVGESDIALVTLMENVPTVVTPRLAEQVKEHYRDSGEYVEREALRAVKQARQAA